MKHEKAGDTQIMLGYAGEHNNTEITFDLPCDWTDATSDTVYLVFVAPGEKIGLPYDLEVDTDKKRAYWVVPECATKAGEGKCQLTLLKEPWEITDENCDLPESISKSPWYNTICLKGVNEMGCDCDNDCGCGSSWLDKIIHFIKKYEHNTLYIAGDGIEITQEGDDHIITNTGGGGGGEPAQYLKTISKDTANMEIAITDKQGNITKFPYGGGEPAEYIKRIEKNVENAQKCYIVITDKDGNETNFGFEAGDNIDFVVNADGTIKINGSGGGSEPAAYLKSVEKDEHSKTIVIADKNDVKVDFPYYDEPDFVVELADGSTPGTYIVVSPSHYKGITDYMDANNSLPKIVGKYNNYNLNIAEVLKRNKDIVLQANFIDRLDGVDYLYSFEIIMSFDETTQDVEFAMFPFSGGSIDEYLATIEKDDSHKSISITDNNGNATTFPFSDNNFSAEDKAKLDGIEAGAQVNDPNTVVDADYVHTDNNFTDDYKNKIDTNEHDISDLQNSKQDKTDNSLPTTAKTVVGAIAEVLALATSALHFKGSVPTVGDLPGDASEGDLWNVEEDGIMRGWNGADWVELGPTLDLTGYRTAAQQDLIDNNKVDKEVGKGLSTNDFDDTYKARVDTNANKITNLENDKVDKVLGKDLSTNDYTDADKQKVADAVVDNAYVHTDNNFTNEYKDAIEQIDKKVNKVSTPLTLYGVDEAGNQLSYVLGDGLEFDGNELKVVGGGGSYVPAVNDVFFRFDDADPFDIYGEGTYEQIVNKVPRGATNTDVGGSDVWTMTEQQLAKHNHKVRQEEFADLPETAYDQYNCEFNPNLAPPVPYGCIVFENIGAVGDKLITTKIGQDAPINNMMAYQNLYMWRRIA